MPTLLPAQIVKSIIRHSRKSFHMQGVLYIGMAKKFTTSCFHVKSSWTLWCKTTTLSRMWRLGMDVVCVRWVTLWNISMIQLVPTFFITSQKLWLNSTEIVLSWSLVVLQSRDRLSYVLFREVGNKNVIPPLRLRRNIFIISTLFYNRKIVLDRCPI
jgi:hypothetical protein